MMIEVNNLTREFGGAPAVDRVSFQIDKGTIVGLLGPNGAGKTTTLRMLSTFLVPSSGDARLNGKSLRDDPLGIRRSVGYLPESAPLYPEMRVIDYLRYRARLKSVPRGRLKVAIESALKRCRINEVARRIIGNLSRGYRQRVGLAESLLGDPPILILDEPTAGLDPIQIREVRELIRELGQDHTVLLSTHILPEVEAICGRVLVLVAGRLALDEAVADERTACPSRIRLDLRGPESSMSAALLTIDGVSSVQRSEQTIVPGVWRFTLQTSGRLDPRESIAALAARSGWGLLTLESRGGSLEERFVRAVESAALTASQQTAEPAASPPVDEDEEEEEG